MTQLNFSEILATFREDLTAAGLNADKYLPVLEIGLAELENSLEIWGQCKVCGATCFVCPECKRGFHPANIKRVKNGFKCAICAGQRINFYLDGLNGLGDNFTEKES